mgnify:CR=1 FL=1
MSENPAERVIRIMGGPSAVAEICGVHVTRVFDWKRERGVRGFGGLIPANHQQTLIDHARANQLELKAEDFFAAKPTAPEPAACVEAA